MKTGPCGKKRDIAETPFHGCYIKLSCRYSVYLMDFQARSFGHLGSAASQFGMDPEHSFPDALVGSFLSSLSRTRRLEDRIRKLCVDAVVCADPVQLERIMERLKAALHDHSSNVRRMAAAGPCRHERRRQDCG